jgi:hypothetical protein
MKRRAPFRRFLAVAGLAGLLLGMAIPASPARAAPSAHVLNGSFAHYYYQNDGTCPDSIDAYGVGVSTLIHIGNFPITGCQESGFAFGDYRGLAVARADAVHTNCLLYSDENGFVDSYVIQSTGSLSPAISHLPTAYSALGIRYAPDNLAYAVASNGASSDLYSFKVGAGCSLTQSFVLSRPSNLYVSSGLVGTTDLVTADYNSGKIDSYTLTSAGKITFLNSVPSQLGMGVSEVAVQTGATTNVFTGAITFGNTRAQGGAFNTATGSWTPLIGSPQSDPVGQDGESVFFDQADNLLIQGELNTGSLGSYLVTGGSKMSFLNHTPLAVANEFPENFVQLGHTLIVDPAVNGDIEACHLSNVTGVTGCVSVGKLTHTGGSSLSNAVL